MAKATVHPNRQLISGEDVKGTDVYATGGFLGLGHSHYPLPWMALKYDIDLAGYVTGIAEQQLRRWHTDRRG
jgi:hypothetical protein